MESFRNCGWPAFAMLFLAFLAFAVGAVALTLAALKKRKGAIAVGAVGIVLSGLALLGGPAGAAYGRVVVDDVVNSGAVDPSQQAKLRAAGYAEAGQCIPVGLSLGALPALVSIGALVLALLAADQARPEAE